MIAFIKGMVDTITENYIVIEANNIGYQVFIGTQTINKIKRNSEIKVFTHTNVREDGITIFGFLTFEELSMFQYLIMVSGIGPKVALGILNAMDSSKIMLAIVTEDIETLSKAPGVGKKTAQRIILDLKDKMKLSETVASTINMQQSITTDSDAKKDAIDALCALGYNKSEALKAVLEVAIEGAKTEQIIKNALKKLI